MTGDPDDLPGAPSDADAAAPSTRPLRTTLVLAGVLVAAFVAAAALTGMLDDERAPGDQAAQPPADAGQVALADRIPATATAPLPDLELDGFGDAPPVALADYHGGPVLVNLWASWCTPCVEEMPDVQDFAVRHDGEVTVLGVGIRDAPSNAAAFVDELGITYDLADDPDGELYTAVEAYGMPTTLFVDATGTIVYRHTGLMRADELAELAHDHLGVGG